MRWVWFEVFVVIISIVWRLIRRELESDEKVYLVFCVCGWWMVSFVGMIVMIMFVGVRSGDEKVSIMMSVSIRRGCVRVGKCVLIVLI